MLYRRFAVALYVAAVPTAMYALPAPGNSLRSARADARTAPDAPLPPVAQQRGVVRGRVIVAGSGAPIGSVQVQLGTRGAQSNDVGAFTFPNVEAGTYSLQIRMLGYERVTRSVTVTNGQTVEVTIELKRMALSLDQVVVTGTVGTARRREIGNSISQIDVTSLPEVPMSVDNLLQGKATGLTVTANSGGVGGGASIRLRGNVSATQNNQPLIYIDGVRVKNDGFPKNTFPTGYSGNSDNTVYSPLNDIDPGDIERIEVIKGPAATTLYGTEAASGVIQIFTKRGQTQGKRWTFQTDQSASTTPKYGPTEGYEGNPIVIPDKEVNPFGTVDYMYLDPWLRTGYKNKYTLSLDGGREDVKYFISTSTSREIGVLPLDKANQTSIRGNLTVTPRKDLTLEWNSSFSTNSLTKTPAGGTAAGLTLNASRRNLNYFGSADPAQIGRVLAFELDSRIDHLVTGGTLQYQPNEQFTTRLIVGYDLATQETRNYMPFGFATVPKGQISNGVYTSRTSTIDYAATYSHNLFAKLRTSFSAGAQLVSADQVNVVAGSRDFPGPGQQTVSNGAVMLGTEDRIKVNNGGLFVQNVFDLNNRYFLTLGVRFDGNSAFGQSLGLQSYPKVSGSYVLSDESFWPTQFGTMKLRAAYGQSGRAPGAFDALRTWTSYSWGGTSAFIPRNLGNPNLGPERTTEIEGGFESSTFDGRLTIDVTSYRRQTKDALFAVSQPPSEGLWSSQLENVGRMQSNGVEVGVNATLLQRKNFGWEAGFTYSTNYSKVLSLGGAKPFTIGNNGWIVEGKPVPTMRGFCVANPDEFATPVRQANCDKGPNTPTHTIGGNTSFDLPWAFKLSTRGEYQGGHFAYSLLDGEAIVRGIRWPPCFNAYAQLDAGNLAAVPAGIRGRCISSLAIRDYALFPLDFFRLRDLTLRRSFAMHIGGVTSALVSLSGQNLLWWKKAKNAGIDAETSGGFTTGNTGMTQQVRSVGGSIPIPRTFLMSVRLTL